MGTVLPTSVTDLCAEAVHRSGNVELSLLNSRPDKSQLAHLNVPGSQTTHLNVNVPGSRASPNVCQVVGSQTNFLLAAACSARGQICIDKLTALNTW